MKDSSLTVRDIKKNLCLFLFFPGRFVEVASARLIQRLPCLLV